VPEHPLVVLMGVAGSGKSTVGPRLARALGIPFVDADEVHADAAKAQMAAGVPLDDAARGPWLDQLHAILGAHTGRGLVLACSALKDEYRVRLSDGLAGVLFVALVAPPDVLEARLEARPDHFAGSALLPSQLHDLELDANVIRIDGTQPVDEVTDAAVQAIRARRNPPAL
jgi:gluconokinase